MKHVKKLASILLALIMVLGLAITAFAAQTYSITIDNALEGETYTAYKIFDLTYSGTNNNPGTTPTAPAPDNTSQHTAYSYTIGSSSEWWNVVTNNYSGTESTFTANNLKFTKTTTGNVWNVEAAAGFSAADFAKLLNENKANKTSAGSAVGTAAGTATINLTPDAAGYYFVDTTTGSLCSLDTTEPSATIREKNTIPSDTKEVKDSGEATETWGETDDAQIGDTVNFKLTVTDGKGTDRALVLTM